MSHPMSAMPTMQIIRMDEMTLSHQNNMKHETASENSTRSCCDEIVSFAIGCSFLVPQYAGMDLSGGNKRVMISDPVFQSISIETRTPPPKA